MFRVAAFAAPDGKVSTMTLKSVAAVVQEINDTGTVSDGDGSQIPIDELDEEAKLALVQRAVTEEEFERHQRRRDNVRRALTSSASVEWYTPPEYVLAVRQVLGGDIDLDPASCAQANETVGASRIYTAQDDGLRHDWHGNIFTNPPYSGLAGKFVAHLLDQYERGHVTAAIALLNGNAHDTLWFRPLFDWPICFAGRLHLISPDGPGTQSTYGSVFVYVGRDVNRFVDVFGAFGPVVRDIRPRQGESGNEEQG